MCEKWKRPIQVQKERAIWSIQGPPDLLNEYEAKWICGILKGLHRPALMAFKYVHSQQTRLHSRPMLKSGCYLHLI